MGESDSRLLDLHVEALFTHDSAGRIVATNEPGGGPAPRFYLGRSSVGNLCRIRRGVPAATARRLEVLAAAEPVRDDLRAEPRCLEALLEALRADEAVRSVVAGPAYRFPDALPAASAVTRITGANLHLLRRMNWNLETLAAELDGWAPMLAVIEDDAAVSLCFSSRLTARAAEAGVETLEPYRGRGYARRVVAAWAHAMRATGRIPMYSTSWTNLASQAVACTLGLIQYGADLSLR
jgi:GNAT superfamily N-acetyltransferase